MTKPKFGRTAAPRMQRVLALLFKSARGACSCRCNANGARGPAEREKTPGAAGERGLDGGRERCFVVRVDSAEEWFDVVNEHDEVVRRATRRDVHANGWWHRAVHVLVFDSAGRVFLQRRSMRKDLSPGKWDSSCSGHLDAGEDYDAAAVRELEEEIGIRLATPPERWFRIEACEPTAWEFVWVYRLRHDGPLTLNADEIQYGEWVAPREVTRRLTERPGEFCPSFQLLWPMADVRLGRDDSIAREAARMDANEKDRDRNAR